MNLKYEVIKTVLLFSPTDLFWNINNVREGWGRLFS